MFVPKLWLFCISLMACEFNPHRETWHQKFAGTYPLLGNSVRFVKVLDQFFWGRPQLPFCVPLVTYNAEIPKLGFWRFTRSWYFHLELQIRTETSKWSFQNQAETSKLMFFDCKSCCNIISDVVEIKPKAILLRYFDSYWHSYQMFKASQFDCFYQFIEKLCN